MLIWEETGMQKRRYKDGRKKNNYQETRKGIIRYANNVITCCLIDTIRQLEQDNKL